MDDFAVLLFLTTAAVIVCACWLYTRMSAKIDEVNKKLDKQDKPPAPYPMPFYPQPQAPVPAAPVPAPVSQPLPSPAPAVYAPANGEPVIRVNSGGPVNDEIMAVIAAAVKMYESETELRQDVSVPAIEASQTSYISPAADVSVTGAKAEVNKPKKAVQSIWISTARAESHQRL